MRNKLKDKKVLRLLLIAMFVVTIILGGTFAWLRIGITGSKVNIVKAGTLDLVLDESTTDGIRLEREIPKSYNQGIRNQAYTFKLVNNSPISTDYEITLEDYYVGSDQNLTASDKIADNLIRYILVKNNEEMNPSNSKLLSSGRTIDAGTIEGKSGNTATEINYTLYVWIDSKAGDNATESNIMSKIFNARLGVSAVQHRGTSESHEVGDVVSYNPVSANYCDSSNGDCKDFVVLSKETDNSENLLYLDNEEELVTSSSKNIFTQLEEFTEDWDDSLGVPAKYDLPASTTMPPFDGYAYKKARLPIPSELTEEVVNTIDEKGVTGVGDTSTNFMVTAYNDTNFGMFGINNGESYSGLAAPYGTSMSSNDNYKYYIHPVVNIGGEIEEATFKVTIPSGRTKDTLQDGDMVCLSKRGIGEECFDFMRYEGNNMVMMSMYNLNVGHKSYGVETFRQNSNARGYDYQENQSTYGGVFFSADEYWFENSFRPKEKYGDSFPADVYDESYDTAPDFSNQGYRTPGYSVAYYVKRYKSILESMGANISKARLLTYNEAVTYYGCTISGDGGWAGGGWTCSDSPYLHRTSYWLGTAFSSVHMNYKYSSNGWGHYYGTPDGDTGVTDPGYGVRPIIEMSKDQVTG